MEHLKQLVEKYKTEAVIAKQVEVATTLELNKLKISSQTHVNDEIQTLRRKQNELLVKRLRENEDRLEQCTK